METTKDDNLVSKIQIKGLSRQEAEYWHKVLKLPQDPVAKRHQARLIMFFFSELSGNPGDRTVSFEKSRGGHVQRGGSHLAQVPGTALSEGALYNESSVLLLHCPIQQPLCI